MACEDLKTAFEGKLRDASAALQDELQGITRDTESRAQQIADAAMDGTDLAQGVGAAAGTAVGGLVGGPAGAVVGHEIGKTIGSLFKLTVSTERVSAAMDVPRITMRDQAWIFSVPAIEMRANDIIYNLPTLVMRTVPGPMQPVPVCRMEQRCIGSPPFRVCTDVPVCYIDYRPTSLDVPTWEDREHRISLDLPVVVMRETRVVVGVPEITMERQDVSLDLPRIKLEFIQDAGHKTAEAAAQLQAQAEAAILQRRLAFRERVRFEVIGPATAMFDCFKQQLRDAIAQTQAMFDPQIAQLGAALQNLAAQQVPATHENHVRLKASMDDLVARRDEAVGKLQQSLAELEASAQAALDRLINEDFEEEASPAAAAPAAAAPVPAEAAPVEGALPPGTPAGDTPAQAQPAEAAPAEETSAAASPPDAVMPAAAAPTEEATQSGLIPV